MLMPLTAEDVVVGIFYYLKQHDKNKLTADREILHRTFFRMKETYPQVMNVFGFRNREHFPESSQLDQALSNLDASGLISRENHAPKYYFFKEPLSFSYDKYSKSILAQAGIVEKDLQAIAQEMESLANGN